MNLNRYTLRRIMRMLIALIIIIFIVFHIEEMTHYLIRASMLLTPFFIGGGMAFFLNVPMRFFERRVFTHINNKYFKKVQRGVSILLSLVLVALVITIVGVLVVPQLIDSVTLFASNIPKYADSLEDLLQRFVERVPDAKPQVDEVLGYINHLSPEMVQESITNFMKSGILTEKASGGQIFTSAISSTFGLVTSIFSVMLNIVLGFVFALYILVSKEKLAIQGRRIVFAFLSNDFAKYVIHVFQVAFAKFYSFLTGQMAEACILGTLMTVGMFVLRLPYPLMIGVLIGFTALIPIAGAVIGGAISFLLVLSVDPTQSLIFLIFMIIVQQFESHVIYPSVVGSSVGLPAMWTLFAITIGGSLFGLVGMLVFVPLLSTIYTLFAEIVYGRLMMKHVSRNDPLVVYGVPDDKRLPR